MYLRFSLAFLVVMTAGGYAGYRIGTQQAEFVLPFGNGSTAELEPRDEFVPLERLGLSDGARRATDTGSPFAGFPDRALGFVSCVHSPEGDRPVDLLLSSARAFPYIELDGAMRIVVSPADQLNQGRAATEDRAGKDRAVSGQVAGREPASADSVDPGALGGGTNWRETFLVGARLVAVEGKPVRTTEEYEAAYANHHDYVLIRYTLEVPGVEHPVEFIIWKVDWTRAGLIFASGLAVALLGLVVIYLQPGTYSARGFLFFAVTLGIFSMFRAIPPLYRTPAEAVTFSLLMVAMPAATGIFLATFSPLRQLFPRPRRVAVVLVIWGVGIWLLSQATQPGITRLAPGAPFMLWALTMLVFVLLPLPSDYLIRWSGVPLGAMDRQRGKTIRLATLVAFLPIAVQTVYQEITKNSGWVWVDLCTLLFPAIVAFAVLRRGLLVVDEIVLHGLVLLLLSACVGVGYSGVLALSSKLAPQVGFMDSGMFSGFLLGVLTFSAGGVQLASRRWVSERMNRLPQEYESLLTNYEDETLTIIDPQPFCDWLAPAISKATGGAQAAVFVCKPGRPGKWWLAARTGEWRSGPHAQVIGSVLDIAATEKAMIARDALLDDIEHAGQRRELAAAFRDLRASLLFPLVYESEVWGVLAIGDRPCLRPFRPSELLALKRLVEQAAVRMRAAAQRAILQRQNRRASSPRIAQIYPEYPPHIGAYRIDRALGRGGMAFVYRGWREGRPYAIKVPNLTVQGDVTLMKRFAQEARTLLRLRHPHVLTVDKVGDEGGEPWIAMEYLPMGTLADLLKQGEKIPDALARSLTRQVALGLAAAQGEGIIHRDIKPANIFFISADTVKVGDFGLAKVGDMTTLTTITKLMGTPGYMAPEIWENKGADWASDQYALGVTFFEMLTGERPFKADSMVGLMKCHVFMSAPDVRSRGVEASASTVAVLARMLAKEPEDRFSSYAELVAALA